MTFIDRILPLEQRRMKITLIAMGINYALFTMGIVAIMLGREFDFSDMGGGLALVNAPILTFLIGESIRPTGYKANKEVKSDESK